MAAKKEYERRLPSTEDTNTEYSWQETNAEYRKQKRCVQSFHDRRDERRVHKTQEKNKNVDIKFSAHDVLLE